MMVDHQHVETEPLCLSQRLDAGGAAIDRDQQRCAFAGERTHRLHVRPIAFEDAIGNVDQRIEAGMAQVPGEQCCRRRAVDIVVAEDRDALALDRSVGDALRRRFHIRQRERIRHQLAHGRIEEIGDRIELDATAGENAREHFRQLMPLRDRQRARSGAHVEPVAPDLSRGRACDAQERQPVVHHGKRWECSHHANDMMT